MRATHHFQYRHGLAVDFAPCVGNRRVSALKISRRRAPTRRSIPFKLDCSRQEPASHVAAISKPISSRQFLHVHPSLLVGEQP